MRSKLFVPGSRPELFEKAARSPADALSFDLEDAVAKPRKAEARANVAAFLRGGRGAQTMVVRVNGVGTEFFEDDIDAIVGAAPDMINVPMLEGAEQVRHAAAAIARAEAKHGVARAVGILANIETPRGLRLAAEIATADRRVVALQVGFGDLFEPFGIDRMEPHAVQHVRMQVRLAAAEAGIPAYDGALAVVATPETYRADAEAARLLGYAGKSCIHPTQVPIANEVFVPQAKEIARAARVVAAADDALARGVGAFVVDGDMVDGPFIDSARAVLAMARKLGLAIPETTP
jgi:citrate lyase subunit beta / citryl-CoA lyase